MEDITRCFISFPQFRADIGILIEEGVVKHDAFDQYEWVKSKTSLAEYFKWIGSNVEYVPGGFWEPIETTFRIKRGTLRKLADNNANPLKPPESKDFMKIKAAVQQQRARIDQEKKERSAFNTIKKLIGEVEGGEPEKIREILHKIKEILS
ncbi:hypothetical protein [Leadbettera azotonutricia]|nr:hypothetical protein [Leadbettera azotonutricia]